MMLSLRGVVVVTGFQGAGKTLFMTKTAFEQINDFQHIYSNYNLHFYHEKLDLIDMYKNKVEIKNSIILIDEGHLFFNARSSMSEFSKMMSWFFTQTRKRGNLVMITQIPGMLDINIRQRSAMFHVFPYPLAPKKLVELYSNDKNYYSECEKYERGKRINCIYKKFRNEHGYHPLRRISPNLVILYELPIKFFDIEIWSNPASELITEYYYDATEYYELYDTEELIFPDWNKLKEIKRRRKNGRR